MRAESKPTVTVNDLEPQGLESSSDMIISDRLRNELFRTGAFTVVECGQMVVNGKIVVSGGNSSNITTASIEVIVP